MSVGINFPFSLPVFSVKVCSFILLFSNLIWIYSLAFPSEIPFLTYPLFWIVEIVGAYVENLDGLLLYSDTTTVSIRYPEIDYSLNLISDLEDNNYADNSNTLKEFRAQLVNTDSGMPVSDAELAIRHTINGEFSAQGSIVFPNGNQTKWIFFWFASTFVELDVFFHESGSHFGVEIV